MRRWETVPRKGRELFRHPLAPATLAVLRERGYTDATVAEFCARAGVKRTELPRRFRFKPIVCLVVSEAYVGDFKARVGAAFAAGGQWPGSLRAAAYETLRWIADHPDAAWWGTVGVLEVGEVGRARRDAVFEWAATLIEAGREVAPDPDAVPRNASTMAVGAIVETLGRRVQGTLLDDPVAAVPRLMYGAVLPYLGEEVALRELDIPAPDGFPADVGAKIATAFDDASWHTAA
jgi:AcrR family transcriptional regulator